MTTAAASLAGCGGGSPEATPAPAPKPAETAGGEKPAAAVEPAPQADIAALFAQEQAQQSVHLISTADGKLRAQIEAATTPTVEPADGFVVITAPNGPTAIQCFAYPERKDTAEVLRVLAASTLGKAAPEHQWVDVHGDHANGWPYVIARAHYLVSTPQGKMAGDFKIASSSRGATTVACLYDAPGHYATFERVVRGLLETLDTAENRAEPKPLEAEITRTRLAGRMVSLSLHEKHKEGNAEVVEGYDASITIGPEGGLETNDDASTETYRKGRLESATYAQSKEGAIDYMLELASKKDLYTVAGTVQEKPFKADFAVAGGLPDPKRSDAVVCDVHRGKKPSGELLSYIPDADPSGPTPMTFEKSPTPGSHLRMSLGKMGAMVVDVTVDDDCEMVKGSMNAGGVAIEIERIWTDENKGKGK
jgi:hypothetical protein